MAKFIIGLSLVSILSAVSVSASDDHCPSSGFILNTLQGDGYSIRAASNSNKFNITNAHGLELQVTISKDGFLVTGNDAEGVQLSTNCRGNHGGQVEFSKKAPAKKPCESQKFPDGYQVTIGIGAHKYHNTPKTWNDARNTCINEGGHLVVINSDAEEKIILKRINEAKWEDTWLGIHDLFSFRDWVTVQDVRLNETGWATWSPLIVPNPDNFGGNQHCVRLLRQSGMDDLQCSAVRNFVCEISCDNCLSTAHELDQVSVH